MTPAQRAKLLNARDGHRCAWTGQDTETLVPHHRVNRGMGGSKQADNIANLVWLDAGLNGLIESDAHHAREALARGIKLRSWQDPTTTPIVHAVHGVVLLLDDGTVIKEPAL